jgi:hypothetical protein
LLALLSPALVAQQQPRPDDQKVNMVWGSITRSGPEYRPLTGKERASLYVRASYKNPAGYFRAMLPAIGEQRNDEPHEWGQGTAGYARRFGNHFGRFVIQDSYEAITSAAIGQEVRYVLCPCKGVWKRSGYALGQFFFTLNQQGRYVPAYSRIGTTFAAEFTANTWMPPRLATTGEAMRGVGLQIGFGSVFNLVKEFSPEIRRILKRK